MYAGLNLISWNEEIEGLCNIIAVATTEADEAIPSSDFLKIMGIPPQKETTGVILVSFDHFTSSDFDG